MTTAEICALPVSRLAEDDAHLWLWVTNGDIFETGPAVMGAWGFSYRSCLTWIKPRFGLGHYLRNQTEHLLFGVRGRAPVLFKGQGTWTYAPLQEHSHKPEEQYAIIERCSPGPYLELFARRKQPGWHSWGNQVECDVRIEDY
jgi:N6-adenosine-specific RNA methylase IME4